MAGRPAPCAHPRDHHVVSASQRPPRLIWRFSWQSRLDRASQVGVGTWYGCGMERVACATPGAATPDRGGPCPPACRGDGRDTSPRTGWTSIASRGSAMSSRSSGSSTHPRRRTHSRTSSRIRRAPQTCTGASRTTTPGDSSRSPPAITDCFATSPSTSRASRAWIGRPYSTRCWIATTPTPPWRSGDRPARGRPTRSPLDRGVQVDHALSALAWTRHEGLVREFVDWTNTRPALRRQLHISPSDYARVAGSRSRRSEPAN